MDSTAIDVCPGRGIVRSGPYEVTRTDLCGTRDDELHQATRRADTSKSADGYPGAMGRTMP